METERKEIRDLLAPETNDHKVADATSLTNIVVDPSDGRNAAIVSASGYYTTVDGGKRWSTDFLPLLTVPGPYNLDPNMPDTQQYAVGVSLDRAGHTYVALQDPISPNVPYTGNAVALATGTNHARYLINQPTLVFGEEGSQCGEYASFCNNEAVAQGVVTDLSGTSTDGNTYLYYLINCLSPNPVDCSFQYGESALFAAQVGGAGYPYLGQVSNQYEELVIRGATAIVDSSGVPHFIYTDFARFPTVTINLDQQYGSLVQFTGTTKYPAATTPSCAGHGMVAYCAFAAGNIGTGAPQANVNIYLAVIDLQTATATVTLVNDDPPGKGKDHFNPSATVTPNGDVYVGWFDDRRDASNLKADYFLARSTDNGKSFPTQKPINDVSFPLVIRTSTQTYNPVFTGSIASGPHGVVHAAWTDIRNGSSVQVYSREVDW